MPDFVLNIEDWGEDTTREEVVVGENWTKIPFKKAKRMGILAFTTDTAFALAPDRELGASMGGVPFKRDALPQDSNIPFGVALGRKGANPPVYVRGSSSGDTVSVYRTF